MDSFDPKTGLSVPLTAIFMVYLVIFMDSLGATISTPALPYYALRFGCDATEIGYLFAAWSLTSTCFAPLLGRVADRVGRRTVLLASLVGAGTAAILQGVAPTYRVLLFSRAFSGVWAAVGSTASVYVSDVSDKRSLAGYLGKLSAVPSAAMIFGPGLGGGLSKFGLQVPILVDGCVAFASAALVFFYLPESPAWVASRSIEMTPLASDTVDPEAPPPPRPAPSSVSDDGSRDLALLKLSQLLNGIVFGTAVSMLSISLKAKLDFDALRVGYTFMGLAIVMLGTVIWITPLLQKALGVHRAAVVGSVVTGIAWLGFASTNSVTRCILWLGVARAAQMTRGASFGAVAASFTTVSTRGTVLSAIQLFLNAGRLVGPLAGGRLAAVDATTLPWILAAACSVLSALVLAFVRYEEPAAPLHAGRKLVRGFTSLGTERRKLDHEEGSDLDRRDVGIWLGDLLAARGYRWVSKKESVRQLIEALLPPLSEESGAAQLEGLEKIMAHASALQKEL